MVLKEKNRLGEKEHERIEKKQREKEMEKNSSQKKTVEGYCFPNPRKRRTTSPTRNVVTEGRKALQEGTNNSTA